MKTKKIYSSYAICTVLIVSLLAGCTLKDVDTEYKTYPITTSAGVGGSVSEGDLLRVYNSSVTVVATPDSNYAFLGWYEDATQVSANASYIFTVTGARTLVAQFKDVHQYECTVQVVGKDFGMVSGMGLVKGAGLHTVGDTIHLLASASEGHHFLGWYAAPDSSALVSVDSTFVLGCTGDTTLYSMFIANLDTLTLTSDSAGVVSGGGVYDYGTKVNLIATPHEGYSFSGWYDGQGLHLSDSTTYSFLVRQTSTLEARFSIKTYTITLPPPRAGGTVSGGGDYPYDTTITVKAHTEFGYHFAGWYNHATGGSESTDSVYSFKVSKSDTLDARFMAKPYIITLLSSPTVGGLVSGGGTFPYDSTITVKAHASVGYSFAGWYPVGGRSAVSTDSVYTITVSGSSTLIAHFTAKPYTITLPPPTAGGTVSGGGDYPYDTTITVKAHTEFGYHFQGWYDHFTGLSLSTDTSYSFTVKHTSTLDARFMAKPYIITLLSSPGVGGLVSGGGTFPYDSTVTVKAHASVGYSFEGWYPIGSRSAVSTDSVYSITVSGSKILIAHFTAKPYTITLPPPTAGGTVSGGGDYPYDTTITVKAHTEFGYHFQGWYDHFTGLSLSTDTSYSFTVKHTSTLDARFTAKPYTIILLPPTAGGTVSGGGDFPYDSTITVKAHTEFGYSFAGWYNHATGGLASADSTYIFKVSGSSTLEARFFIKTYTIALSQNSTSVSGTVTGGGDFPDGSTITVRSASPAGYEFGSWYDLDSTKSVSQDSVYSFQLSGNRRLQARYVVEISRKHIPSGKFTMGSPDTESGRYSNETQHEVTLTHDFEMSTYEITWAQYLAYCTATGLQKPSDDGFGQGDHPVTNVNWNDAVAFCAWVGAQTGIVCRLPTEAEWEYAARGGNNGQYHTYSGSDIIDDVAWYSGNSMNRTQPVRQKQPNVLGLYDMSGNVFEWCSDWYGDYGPSVTDPTGPTSGSRRVLRGGGWNDVARYCRSASRSAYFPENASRFIGFRVVFVP